MFIRPQGGIFGASNNLIILKPNLYLVILNVLGVDEIIRTAHIRSL